MPRFITVKQYHGNYSGDCQISINIDMIRCIYDKKGDRNKSAIYFVGHDSSIDVAPTRTELLAMIESL